MSLLVGTILALSIVLNCVLGFVVFILIRIARSLTHKLNTYKQTIPIDPNKPSEVRDVYAQLSKINDEQHFLVGQLDLPSSGASHSKHKNQIATRLKELEQDKLVLLEKLLELGENPVLTVYTQEGRQNISISELVDMYKSQGSQPDDQAPKTSKPSLKLIKDDGDEPGNRTLH